MNNLLYIIWSADPIIFELGPLSVRWYGLLFASAFLVGHYIMQAILKRENLPKEWMDSLLMYTMVGTVLGARLGHVFFYQWDYYQNNLMEILMIWKGGLASHGAVIGITLAMILWSRKISKRPLFWIGDRIVIVIALGAMFIRGGNFFNHEIVGKPTQTESGVKFLRNSEDITIYQVERATEVSIFDKNGNPVSEAIDQAYHKLATDPALADVLAQIPNRYPAQLFEAMAYLSLFLILIILYMKTGLSRRIGFFSGLFFVYMFVARFGIEYFKEVQVDFEKGMSLDMGQWLSIPFILAGFFLMWRAFLPAQKLDEPA